MVWSDRDLEKVFYTLGNPVVNACINTSQYPWNRKQCHVWAFIKVHNQMPKNAERHRSIMHLSITERFT